MCESGFEHLGVQPGDLVGHRRCGVDGGQWEQLPGADFVHRRLVGSADGRGGELGIAQRHLGGDVAHERHQRRQPDTAVETGSERFTCCAEWVWAWSCAGGYSSRLVIAVSGEFGGVAGPVAPGLTHPFDRCGRCEAGEVGERGGG